MIVLKGNSFHNFSVLLLLKKKVSSMYILYNIRKIAEDAAPKFWTKTGEKDGQFRTEQMDQEIRKGKYNKGGSKNHNYRYSNETDFAYQQYMSRQKKKYNDHCGQKSFTRDKAAAAPTEPPQRPHRFGGEKFSTPFQRVYNLSFNYSFLYCNKNVLIVPKNVLNVSIFELG